MPALPRHVAFHWLCRQLAKEVTVTPLAVPTLVDQQVPNPLRSEKDVLYTSFADFRCPDNCDEPAEYCTVTGIAREENLFDVLGEIVVPGFAVRVLRSRHK